MTALQGRPAQVAQRDFEGRVGLVTGGAGGLGSAICERLRSAGATVVAADIKAPASADGTEVLELDLTDAEAAMTAPREVINRYGRLDFVVNNAGVDLTAPIGEMPVGEWDRILDVNLRAPFVVSKAAFDVMSRTGGGAIVNIVSTASKRAWANASAYHASKWGLLGLSHALHVEGREQDIKVTAVIAGGMRTPFLLDRFPDIDLDTLLDPSAVAETVAFALSQPGRVVIPEIMVLSMKETSWP
jgi:NAD(P)-dependent dehydrogenase (short-subunit alcohol dehydrogenase family)